MRKRTSARVLWIALLAASIATLSAPLEAGGDERSASVVANSIQIGPRPYFLVEDMDESALKDKLESCEAGPFYRTDFSIAHRGAPLLFPEHTKESYEAGARLGAGIVECDVTFTKDLEFVCRHSQCDLHTTTNILATELADQCAIPFTPAVPGVSDAEATCCTSDITLAEFKRLCGKMDAFNPEGTTVEEYMDGTANWRTDLHATCGTLLTHAESIELFQNLGVKFTPELKASSVAMPFNGLTQNAYAQKLIDEYEDAGVPPDHVWPQSFNLDDVLYWIRNTRYGSQAVYLDGRYSDPDFDHSNPATWSPTMAELVAQDVQILAPPMWMLLALDGDRIVPSIYATAAQDAGLDLIAWTIERSGPLADGGGWYYQTISPVINSDGDMLTVLDVLAKDVGIIGIFSDWPGTVTYYANCMGL